MLASVYFPHFVPVVTPNGDSIMYTVEPDPRDIEATTRSEMQDERQAVDRALILIDNAVSVNRGQPLTNFKGDKVAQWKFLAQCLGPECRDGATTLNQPMKLRYYYVTTIDQADEQTGELRPAVYVVLSDGQNPPVGYWSPYVARDLGRMIAALGTDDFGDGIDVKIVKSEKPGKRAFYGLAPA